MKKILSCIALLSLSFSGVSALSLEEIQSLQQEDATESNVSAATFLAEREIIVDRGSDTSAYELNKAIERKAMMKIVMKVSGIEVIDVCNQIFADVQEGWHCKYIETALDEGFISQNDNFRPDDSVTKTEAMKLILNAKGIEKVQTTSNWQEDYMKTALHHGIIDASYSNYNENATRGWIFNIAMKAMQRDDRLKEINQIDQLMSGEAF